jgi:hypothetical protein
MKLWMRAAVAKIMSKRVSVVGNSALAGVAVFLAWRMSNNIMFVFAAGCLCAVFALESWPYELVPK